MPDLCVLICARRFDMITDSFDAKTEAIISPDLTKDRTKCDVCLITFSEVILEYIIGKYQAKVVGHYKCVTGEFPVYIFQYENKTFGIYKTLLGASATVGILEDVTEVLDCNKFLIWGAAGCLNQDLCYNKIVVPTHAYRDEGTSYHYAPPADYIEIINANIVSAFMNESNISSVQGRCWTTDAFYRETKGNFQKRTKEGCLVVDMECSAMQAVCDYRGLQLYYFLICGDILDAPTWVDHGLLSSANHNISGADIAVHLAKYISK